MNQTLSESLSIQTDRIMQGFRLSITERKIVLCLGDVLGAALAAIASLGLWSFTRPEPFLEDLRSLWVYIPVAVAAWILHFWVFDLYNLSFTARFTKIVPRIAGIALWLLSLYLCVFFFAPRDWLPRLPLLYFLTLSTLGNSLWRWGYMMTFAGERFRQKVLIVGAGSAGRTIARVLQDEGSGDFHVVGFVDDDLGKQALVAEGLRVQGSMKDLLEIARTVQANTIVYAISHQLRADVFQALLHCQAAGLSIIRMPALYEELTERVPVQHVRNEWLLPVDITGGKDSLFYKVFVKLVDYLFCLAGALILLVVGPVIALCIKLDNPGPLFYRQVRLGQGGRRFEVIKFRSMVKDAEKKEGATWAVEGDPRVTRVGRWLRMLRLDELPQVINVLKGDIHLVGPRPERPEFFSRLEEEIPFYGARLAVKPGLTGWAQVKYGYVGNVEETLVKLQYDLYYIKNRSPFLDLKILLKTVWIILTLRGV